MKTPRVLVAFNTPTAFPADKDYTEIFKETDWQTEADVVAALKELEYPYALAGIYDDTQA